MLTIFEAFPFIIDEKGGLKMNNRVLKQYIKSFKNQKTEVFPLILRGFERLINHYARLLGNSDDTQELNLFFIELLFRIETEKFASDGSNSLSRYIAVSLKNKYIEISRQSCKHKAQTLPFYESFYLTETDLEERFETAEMLEMLSQKQRLVIIFKYFYQYSDIEISKLMGISRQAVNNLKNRALETLRLLYAE